MSSARVLLTGATGFVGRQILDGLIQSGRDVVAIARQSPVVRDERVEWRSTDLHDTLSVVRLMNDVCPDLCIHSAWSVSSPDFWTSDDNLAWAASSLQLARAFVASGGQRFVGVGTQAEYVDEAGLCFESGTKTPGSSLYAVAKDSTRNVIETFCQVRGVSFAWARIFNVFGIGEAPYKLIPSVIRKISQGESAQISSGVAVRDFIDVRDVGKAISDVALSAVVGGVNIGTGQGLTVAEVARRIAALMNASDRLEVGALADRPGESSMRVADIGRLRNEAGSLAGRPLEDSLLDTIAYWTQPVRG